MSLHSADAPPTQAAGCAQVLKRRDLACHYAYVVHGVMAAATGSASRAEVGGVDVCRGMPGDFT